MKKLFGLFGAGLFVALAATFLLNRNRNVANERPEQHATDDVLPDAERIAEEMRDEFVPGKLNTGQPSPELLDLNSCSIQDLLEYWRRRTRLGCADCGGSSVSQQDGPALADGRSYLCFSCDQRTREHRQARRGREDRVSLRSIRSCRFHFRWES